MSLRWRIFLFICFTAAVFAAVFAVPRVSQDPAYHVFAENRFLFGIPNFFDVVSNASFLIVGIWGFVIVLLRKHSIFEERYERIPYFAFFIGIALTCFGSAYYHSSPNNERLMWDRIPMTVAFMAILAAVITERIGSRAGRIWLFPMLAAGISSVLYWHLTELKGAGDLRPYVIVQFYTLAAVPLLMLLFPARYTHSAWLIASGVAYLLAKVFEVLDRPIFNLVGISGHTLKHIAASLAAVCIIEMLRRRSLTREVRGGAAQDYDQISIF